MALGAAAKDPSWTLHAVCRYCVIRRVESSPLAGDDASRHPIAAAVVHVRMVRLAPDARTCSRAHKLSHQHARVNRYEGVVDNSVCWIPHHALWCHPLKENLCLSHS